MMMNDSSQPFPQYLSAPIQVLWFEGDDLAFIMCFLMLAILFDGIFWLLLFIGPITYSKVKKNQPRGFFRHFLYCAGLLKLKRYPSYFEKEFIE